MSVAFSSVGSESFTRGSLAEGEDFEDVGNSPEGMFVPAAAALVGMPDVTAEGGPVPPEDLDRVISSSPTLAVGLADRSLTAWLRASTKLCSMMFPCCERYSKCPLFAGVLIEDSGRPVPVVVA